VRSRIRRRQSVPHRQGQDSSAVQRREPNQQGGTLQLPVDLQRHALRVAADVPAAGGSRFLTLSVLGFVNASLGTVLGRVKDVADRSLPDGVSGQVRGAAQALRGARSNLVLLRALGASCAV